MSWENTTKSAQIAYTTEMNPQISIDSIIDN